MSTPSKHGHTTPSPMLDSGFVWTWDLAACARSAYPGSSLGAKKDKTKKLNTHKTRRNDANSCAINKTLSKSWTNLVDFVHQSAPFPPQSGPFSPQIAAIFRPGTESSTYPGSAPNSASSAASVEAPKGKGSDFIHFENAKTPVTYLASTKTHQNPCRFFAIFIDFYAQIDPKINPNRPRAAPAIHDPVPLPTGAPGKRPLLAGVAWSLLLCIRPPRRCRAHRQNRSDHRQ